MEKPKIGRQKKKNKSKDVKSKGMTQHTLKKLLPAGEIVEEAKPKRYTLKQRATIKYSLDYTIPNQGRFTEEDIAVK